jgi:VanZ family protein
MGPPSNDGPTQRPRVVLAAAVNLAYAAALARVSLMARTYHVPVFSARDWLSHGFAYGLHTVLLYILFRASMTKKRAILRAAGTALAFGGFLELMQMTRPTRYFEATDLLANAVGVGIASLMMYLADIRRSGPGGDES